ncbi:choline/carnitine O-acyltransferase [Campylobacter canadensis]|uniref:Choline/carnitine O-acyltransferase n=1 Tax=Campylobacter canadensis TaxID=449520 RepID=A0ABS7WTT1_9BACT|nr:choline/carnitine O-acyltransferase [Campylobacter canadensis]MBZ7987424.1 choline/carnitine O-acyltransferase [Campylobacter canadensis]MBZ7998619.1 choline/carnitine O-acyltransferase [Campylobacter canadensis]
MKLQIPSIKQTKDSFYKHALAYDSFDKKLFDEFFDNYAVKLQEKLIQYDTAMQSSYIQRAWRKSYLSTKKALAIQSNFSFKLPCQYDLNDFIFTLAHLIKDYENNLLEFKNTQNKKVCSRQFDVLKGACRIPKLLNDDFALSFLKTDYISILHNNNLYKARILKDKISAVDFDFKEEAKEFSLAHLSFCKQSKAAYLYDKYEDYNCFFEIMENSRFNICIIDKEFKDLNEEQNYMLYNAVIYHYKSLNFIYNKNSKNIYINAEHSFFDGASVAFILEYIHKNLKKADSFVKLEYIEQYFDDEFVKSVKAEYEEYKKEQSKNQMFCVDLFNLDSFSKDFIMQAAIAYASYFVYSKYVSMYEAVDVREYNYARTECLRAISVELLQALKTFTKEDFLLANNEHKNRIKDCKKGLGIDRHLFMLEKLIPCIKDNKAKEFFNSKMYLDVCSSVVSTSSLGKNEYCDVFYFHPVCSDGLGVSYAYFENKCYFACTYFKDEQFNIFKQKIQEFFDRFNKVK